MTTAKITKSLIEERANAEVEALATLTERRAELLAAQAHRADTEAALKAGDASLPVTALRDAEDAITYWQHLTDAAELAHTRAKRAVLPTLPLLADAIAYAISDKLGYGIKAEAVHEVPADVEASSTIRLYVTQEGMHQQLPSGAVAGRVSVKLIAPEYVAGIDADKLDSLLRAGYVIRKGAGRLTGTGSRTIRFDVAQAFPEVPVIASEPTNEGKGIGQGWLDLETPIARGSYSSLFGGETIVASRRLGEVVSSKIKADVRTTVADVAVSVTPATILGSRSTYLSHQETVAQTQDYLSKLVGKRAAWLGRITSVELLPVELSEGLDGRRWSRVAARITTTARTA